MKLLVAATGADIESEVDKRFGHPANYLIVDSDTIEYDSFAGPQQDVPFHRMAEFQGRRIDGAVSGNFGPNAFNSLRSQGIQAYVCRGMSVKEAVEKIKAGVIEPAEQSTMKKSVRTGSGSRAGGMGGGRGRGGGGR